MSNKDKEQPKGIRSEYFNLENAEFGLNGINCKEEDDDSEIIEDMIMNVNPNYIENKK